MPDISVQRRSWLHTGHAPSVELQRLHVSRGAERRCCCPESERCQWSQMRIRLIADALQNLQSADEMEEEEKAAQSAKLQELIRRGGPEDLQEANRLMKVMAGYDTKHKTDYRAKAAEEVGKIQQKAKLLEERLQQFKPGDQLVDGDIFEVRVSLKDKIPDL